jgi:gliding motility-associated-like protein
MTRFITHLFVAISFLFSSATMAQDPVILTMDPQMTTAPGGSTVSFTIEVENFTDIISMQFSVNYDTTVLELQSVGSFNPNLPGFGPGSVGVPGPGSSVPNGVITVSWLDFALQARTLTDGEALFTMNFTAIGPPCSMGAVAISDKPNVVEFFTVGPGGPFDFVPINVVYLNGTGVLTVEGSDCNATCGIGNVESGNDVTIVCGNNTIGANNDPVTILIGYTGVEADALITNNGSGTIGGDDPAVVANGTIEITGLQEGDSWNISITGGGCDFTSTGTVAANQCDPLPCGITGLESGNNVDFQCNSNTLGANNDQVTVLIDYTGVDANALITNNGSGVVGGDNPASVPNGTIEISGLSEGDNWNVEISGGNCNLQSTGTIGGNICDPVACGITDIETGSEVSITCLEQTGGSNVDEVLIEIDYIGSDPAITLVNNGAGTIGGDDPASVPNGTITINGLTEGDQWDISITSPLCDLSSTGQVDADLCLPDPCTITGIETGNQVDLICGNNTSGLDPVGVEIAYTGIDPNAMVVNNGGGTVGGDDPATVPNGVIVITGLSEGDDWDISIEGGSCALNSSGSIPSDLCLPPPCGISDLENGNEVNIVCQTNNPGDNNDAVVLEISYTGIDANAVVVNNGTGTVGGDDPAVVANGTIEISGLSEGDSWDISITGGQCSLQSTGTVASDHCDVVGCGITDLETGNEVTFNCQSNTTGANNDNVTIEISYTGIDPNASVDNNGSGTISGNNPAITANGTILINGLGEGDSWNISITGGACDLQSTGTVPTMECDPIPCGITDIETGSEATILCSSNTAGSNNDNVTVQIAYTGLDAGVTIINNGGGILGGDDPAVVANGTIEISGLSEGNNWNISLNSANCNLTSAGTVNANFCDPAPCGITDIETGFEASITCITTTSGGGNDEVLLEIEYTGIDPNAVITNNGGGTIGGDNPATVADGTIEITGLMEGESWDIDITGSTCALSSTGTVPNSLCEPTNCGITDVETGNEVNIICVQNTNGTGDDVIVQIDYLGSDPAVSITNNGSGTVGGDNPASVADGTIEISNLQEGDSWNITISGGGCSFNSSGTVSANACTPTTLSDSLVLIMPDVTVENGDQLCLEVSIENFTDIASMQFSINFNAGVLDFDAVEGITLPGLGPNNFGYTQVDNGIITFSWDAISSGSPSVTLPDGTVIFELCFNVIGGGGSSTDVDFSDNPTTIEISTPNVQNIGLIDLGGMVNVEGNDPNTLVIDIGENEGAPGDTVCVDFVVQNFVDLVSLQFGVDWDENILDLVGPQNFNGNVTGLGPANFNEIPAGLILSWNDLTAQGVTLANGSTLFSLCFEIIGNPGQESDVFITDQFTAIEVINGSSMLVNLNPVDGSVNVLLGPTTDPTVYTECQVAAAGENVCIPVKMDNFDDLLGAQFTLTWGDDVLEFTGVQNFNTTLNVNPSNFGTPDQPAIPDNALTFAWNDPFVTGVTLPDGSTLFDVCFDVVGNDCDSTDLEFINSPTVIEFTQINGPVPFAALGCEFKSAGCFGLDLSADITNLDCFGDSDGAIDLTVSGGTAPLTYAWDNNADTEDLSNLTAGNYSVTVTDGLGNTATETYTVTEPAELIVNISGEDLACNGDGDGSITLSVSGGVAPYTYDWNDNTLDGQQNPSGLSGGTYTVTITDGNGCTDVASITITEPEEITLIATVTSAANGTGGGVDITVSGGTPNYFYLWNDINNSTTEDLTNVGPGTYSVTITDANGCTKSGTYTVIDIADCMVNLTFNSFASSCPEASNGSINLTVSGAIAPVEYTWTGPSAPGNVQDPSGLESGQYCVTVTDAVGCIADTCINVAAGPGINVVGASEDATCQGAADGSIMLSVSAGTGPFTYDWDDDTLDGIKDPTGLVSGTYCVTVTDANGCPESTCVDVEAGPGISVTATPTAVTCNGGTDGSISVSVTNGSGNYTYEWSDAGLSGSDPAGLAPGSYTVTVTDNDSDCFELATAVVEEPDLLDVNVVPTDVSCFGAVDGSAVVNVQGGVNPYTYEWTGGLSGGTPTDIEPGDYTVTVTDANGCTGLDDMTISEPDEILLVLVESISPLCFGEPTGSITVDVEGGTAPYSYQWINVDSGSPLPSNGQTISNLLAGNYNVEVTDANDCTVMLPNPVTLTSPAAINLNATVFDPVPGQDNGQIVLNVTGGIPPYNYTWSGGLPSGLGQNNQSNLASGIYSVTVTDDNGCTKTGTYEAIANFIFAPAIVEDVVCHGDSTGSIDITPLGGLPPYEYMWMPTGDTIQDLSDLPAGTYTVMVTDQKGTKLQQTYTIEEPDSPLDIVNVEIECDNGSNSGSINIEVDGGSLPYSYQWSNGASSEDIQNLQEDCYKVTITDGNGCIFVSEEICVCFQPDPPVLLSLEGTNPSCAGGSDGSISVEIQSLGQPITYQWVTLPPCDPDTINIKNPNGLMACTYVLIATDAFGQSVTASVTLSEPDPIGIAINQIQDESCPDGDNGAIYVNITGGTAPYDYGWSNGMTSPNITDLSAGFYTLTVTDSKGCVETSPSIEIKEQPPCFAGADITEVDCAGDGNGAITVNIDGGIAPYEYKWKDDDGNTLIFAGDSIIFNPTITGLDGGNYFVTVTDANGNTQTTVFFVPEPMLIDIMGDVTASTSGNNGAIDLTVTGGTPAFMYEWNDASTTADRSDLPPGIYSVTVTDTKGCTSEATFQVNGAPVVGAQVVDVGCVGDENGSIDLTVQGIPDFTYTWQGPGGFVANTEDIDMLAPGTYFVTVVDGNSMTTIMNYTIGTTSFLDANASVVEDPIFPTSNDGEATVFAADGVEPYSYQWCSGETTAMADQLPVGICVVTVTDAQGCVATDTIELLAPSIPVSYRLESPTCPGECDGEAEVIHEGGRAPFTYSWNDSLNQVTRTAVMLCPGTYTVTITDNFGYFEVKEVEVPDADGLDITFETVPSAERDGEIEVFVDGGVEPYFYNWSNGSKNKTIRGLDAGTYTITVTDAQGCTEVASIELEGNYDCGLARNVITPNQDGRNDNFIVNCADVFSNTLTIFNRWGELVFQTENYDNTWEGRDLDGNDVPEGGYFYIFEYEDTGVTRQVKGSLTVIRE